MRPAEGPPEKLFCYIDKILRSITQQQKSHLDTTDSINFIEKTKLQKVVILLSMDVTSLYKNILSHSRPHPKFLLEKAPKLTWLENSFQFSEQNYLQMHGTAMGTNMSVAFSDIFMAKIANPR